MEICYILDASAFINGFQLVSKNNFTVPEITEEIKDFESKLTMDMAIEEDGSRYILQNVSDRKSGVNFLEMWGVFENGSFFMLRSSVESIKESVAQCK